MRASLLHLFRTLGALVALGVMRPLVAAFMAFCALSAPALAQDILPIAQENQRAARPNNISAQLVAESGAVPGKPVTLALVFTPKPGWHGYWSNPGDAGLGMDLAWSLPEGWTAGEPLYPVPHKLLISGLMNHVFKGPYAVLVPIEVPAGPALTRGIPIRVKADWLACTDTICVPESAELETTLVAGGNVAGANVAGDSAPSTQFAQWRAQVPPLLDQPAQFELRQDALNIAVPLPASMALANPHVFIEQTQLVDYAAPQAFHRDGDRLIVVIPTKGLEAAQGEQIPAISGILKLDDNGTGIAFAAQPAAVAVAGERLAGSETQGDTAFIALLGAALLGGVLLNLMPCVFPILSLKAMSLARASESEASARRDAVAYTAGVMLACIALGGLLLALRAGGSAVGWAFQLQEPGVVIALLVLAAAITANFAGLFEVPSLAITRSGGRASAFSTGLLAAFVATPCTGPFMAAALGAALILPPVPALALFAALGFGLSLPFLLLGFVPALRRILPKPGPWMERFRKIMAVPMGLTALALVWLAWRLGGPWFAGLGLVLAGLAVAALVMWRKPGKAVGYKAGRKGWHSAVPVLGAVAAVAAMPAVFERPASAQESLLPTEDYSAKVLAEARASGAPVFVYFTADWCLTCKVNEKVAIEREDTRTAFEKAGVKVVRGDWTVRDAAITAFLTEHGAAGVPLYLWYAPGAEGEILPQVLTPAALVALAEKS